MNRGPLMRMVHGALAGIDGAATMTVVRMAAHRVGLIDQMVPQKVEQWTRSRRRRRSPGTARVVEHVMHLGYGASWGALFGLIAGRDRPTALRVVGFGIGLWGLGALVLFPSLGIGRPAWRSSSRENFVNVAAHLAFAQTTAFLVEEFGRQPREDVMTTNPRRGRVG